MGVPIDLDEDAALVLLDWVSCSEAADLPAAHPAERLALWDLESALELALAPTLRMGAGRVMEEARGRLLARAHYPGRHP